MRTILKLLPLLLIFAFSGCSSRTVYQPSNRASSENRVPPGQAKKITGEKSARNHAPGRRNK